MASMIVGTVKVDTLGEQKSGGEAETTGQVLFSIVDISSDPSSIALARLDSIFR